MEPINEEYDEYEKYILLKIELYKLISKCYIQQIRFYKINNKFSFFSFLNLKLRKRFKRFVSKMNYRVLSDLEIIEAKILNFGNNSDRMYFYGITEQLYRTYNKWTKKYGKTTPKRLKRIP